MQFVLYHSKNKIDEDKKSEISEVFSKTTSIRCESINYEWISEDKKTVFIAYNPRIIAYEKYNVFDTTDNRLSFIHGWVKKVNEDKLLEADELILSDDDELDGLYLLGILDENAQGRIIRSLASSPIYYATKDDDYCISSRLFTVSKIFNYTKINKKHVASHIELQNVPVTDETIYENIHYLLFGTDLILSDKIELKFNPDFLYDEELTRLYDEDSDKYWDECLKRIKSQTKAFIDKGLTGHLTMGITGGTDSRLILSLYHELLEEAFTGGPAYSPEVFIGRLVCEKLNLKHNTPALKQTAQSENLLRRMSQHIFDRQFEMSPWDLGRLFPKPMNTIKLDGFEYLKQDVFTADVTKDDLINRSKQEITRDNIIFYQYTNEIINDDLKLENKYIDSTSDLRKYPKVKRILNNGRWFSAAHETEFNHRFNILPLATNTLVKFSYNSSCESINSLDCHYELIKRSTPQLLDVPFFNNEFKQNPLPRVENKIPGKLNYKNVYLVKYYDYIHKYIKDNYELISDIVKKEFIDQITLENIDSNVILSQKVYNILEAIVLFKTSDSYDLVNEVEVDFEVEEEKNIDTTDDDIIKAFIEYNMDIVNLKVDKNNKTYNLDNINELTKNIEDKDKLIEILYKNKYELEEKNEELYEVIKDKNRQIKDLDKFNNDKTELISKLKENNLVLKEKYQHLEDEKKVMINSTSWKITKPIRTISDNIKKDK